MWVQVTENKLHCVHKKDYSLPLPCFLVSSRPICTVNQMINNIKNEVRYYQCSIKNNILQLPFGNFGLYVSNKPKPHKSIL